MSLIARSLQLFFIDGRPDGMLTAEVFNWTGHVLRIPRTQLKAGLDRTEAKFTGVYVLIGEQNGTPLAYVGEAEDMASRLRNHAATKDWWDTAILITTSANNLHKAHVRHLEARLVQVAHDVAAMPLENGNQPSGSSLSEADRANMESFLDTLMMVLPAIRVDNFLSKKRVEDPKSEVELATVGIFELKVKKLGLAARAHVTDGEVVVLKGSEFKFDPLHDNRTTAVDIARTRLVHNLLETGVVEQSDDHGVFIQDYAFASPSGASDFITGYSSNGRLLWRLVGTNQTYADWEAAQLAEGTQ